MIRRSLNAAGLLLFFARASPALGLPPCRWSPIGFAVTGSHFMISFAGLPPAANMRPLPNGNLNPITGTQVAPVAGIQSTNG